MRTAALKPSTSRTSRTSLAALAPLTAAALLAGCAALPGGPSRDVPALAAPVTPAQWQAPLPHAGSVSDLTRWWQQFDDPLLADLVSAAQAASPSLAVARSRIEQARAARVASGAALGPTLNANASASRGKQDLAAPVATALSASLQAGWELDLFGANGAGRDAAQARLDGAQAGWHEARVSVAAEVASSYLALRACEAQRAQTELDAGSRAETARLTALTAKAGFQAPANAALARASAAQGQANLSQQRAACDLVVKGLVALTGLAEPTLRERLAAATARIPQPAQIAVAQVPAEALAQRPDLYSAGRELVAASAEVSQAQAQRLPSISLAGSIGPARFETGAGSASGTLWSIGPVVVSLPLFDGGRRRANSLAAQARYDEAVAVYQGKLRSSVREVEEALVGLQSTAARSGDAQIASEGFETSYRATEARYKGGLASLFELEDARRSAVQAQAALIELQRERVAAWIALYRALGGGWSASSLQAAS
jgi:NodT family efflux transporter outer membrane factor (OMF) lipoprotein